MIGKEFGKWTVCSQVDKQPGKHYECICECGNFAIIPGNTLRAGRSTKCKECMYHERFNPERMIGKKFGKWKVVKYLGIRNKYHHYETICECGNTSHHCGADLRAGKSYQCVTCANVLNTFYRQKHGMHTHPVYKVWSSMKHRCNNPKSAFYYRYGGRGIKVCKRWNESFEDFYKDMGERLVGMTIDRINNDGDYEPSNCHWVSHKENCNNRSNKKNRASETS